MTKDPKTRPSAVDLLKHPFVENATDRAALAELAVSVVKFREAKRIEKAKRVRINLELSI